MDKMRRWVRNQRGSILLFTVILVVPLMIIIGGLAMDLAYYGTVDDELQRSMDAAALAGAGKLGFNDTFFPAARQWAQDYAFKNPYRVGPINLGLNTANDANGPIVLGIWDGSTFAPSLDGTRVNAVQCRFETDAPTSFLKLIGLNSIRAGAMAIAWAAQPNTTPPDACVLPIGLSSCFFNGPTSEGCGATMSLISSSQQSEVGANTAAWVNMFPPGPASAQVVLSQMKDAVAGTCTGTERETGDCLPATGGELNVVINYLMDVFPTIYNNSPIVTVFKQDGITPAYTGKGWDVYVPVIDTGPNCPPGAISGSSEGCSSGKKKIVGWTRFVMTQVLNSNGTCAVANHWEGNPWDSHCFVDKNGTSPHGQSPPNTVVAGQKGLFGYYDCQYSPVPPAPNPGPITALAKLKLVK